MTGLPRALSGLLLLGGGVAWLLVPAAPAQPPGPALAAGPAQPWGAEEVWLEGPAQDPEEPQPSRSPRVALVEPGPTAPPEPAIEEEPMDESPSERPDADPSLELVRRMLAVHARMAEP